MSAAVNQYPALMKNEGITTLQNALTKGGVTTPRAAMQIIRKLRDDANRVMSSSEPKPEAFALAKIQKTAANAVEDLVGQYLKDSGKTKLFDAFQKSRTQIAKAYAVKNALDGTVLSTAKLARNGEGFTGNLKIIHDMQMQHPNLMLDPRTINTSGGGKASGAMIGTALAAAGQPLAGGMVAARPWLTPLLMSKSYQNLFSKIPDYKVGALTKGALNSLPVAQKATALTAPSLSDIYNRYGAK